MFSRYIKWDWSVWFEIVMAILIVIAIIMDIYFAYINGYFPEPFFHDTTDKFMDWYNTAYWAQHGQSYDIWGSVYPPTAMLFTKIFSIGACYTTSPIVGRSCDKVGMSLLSFLLIFNTALSYFAFKRAGVVAAIPRAIAIGLGAPMLVAWDRGNLIIVTYTFLVLGYGRLLRSWQLKAACAAIAMCFKPYLIVMIASPLLRRKWRWLEAVGVAGALIYAASYIAFGDGDPFQLIRGVHNFGHNYLPPSIYSIRFATTYAALLKLIDGPYPIMSLVGSRPLEMLDFWLPILLNTAKVGVLSALALSAIYPKAISANRWFALTICMLYSFNDIGGYALSFLLFFIFSERKQGVIYWIILICAYLWCLPTDFSVVKFETRVSYDAITNREIFQDLSLTVGQFVRPALFAIIQYGLAILTLWELFIHARWRRDLFYAGRASGNAIARPETA
jgi:hypothetical protein